MKTPTKVITALALAGLAVAGGAAFTAGGLTSTVDPGSAFIGGSITEDAYGANLLGITYTYGEQEPVGTVTAVDLLFDTAAPNAIEGKFVKIAFSGTGGAGTLACEDAIADGEVHCEGSHTGPVDDLKVTVVDSLV